jgi:glycosyltransferase involved in cell wall biosynthesis
LKLVFIQSFSLGDVCGGAKILRSVADHAPIAVSSICTGIGRDQSLWTGKESLIPIRPSLGRIDRTRFHWLGGYLERLWRNRFELKLEDHLRKERATDIHLLPHGWGDFQAGFNVARRLQLRIHVSIHDDFQYTAARHPYLADMEKSLGEVWRTASNCFVITEKLGAEYNRRYGPRNFLIHTDGCVVSDAPAVEVSGNVCRIYFMGLFLHAYRPNFDALIEALSLVHHANQGKVNCQLTLRTGGYKPPSIPRDLKFECLPFTTPEIVEKEMRSFQFLYLPLPFDEGLSNLARFSLSTKMVSYLASGVPILYHGPLESAAGAYLARHEAALCVNTNDREEMAEHMLRYLRNPEFLIKTRENAIKLAKSDFNPIELKELFWNAVTHSA